MEGSTSHEAPIPVVMGDKIIGRRDVLGDREEGLRRSLLEMLDGKGVKIRFYFAADGSFVQSINGRKISLHSWVGVQMSSWIEAPRDWKRKIITEYEPNEVNEYVKGVE